MGNEESPAPPSPFENSPFLVPKITDFGLAKNLDAGEGPLTASGAILGTPGYMAPEQAAAGRQAVGAAADVYALGAILYELLTGRPPFQGETPLDTVMQVVAEDPVPPTRLRSGASRDLETICLKCLEKEPRKRYASASDLAAELGRYLRGEPIRARPVGNVERLVRWARRRPAVAGLLALAALLLVAGTVVSAYFAVQADHRAKEAEANFREARTNEEAARVAVDEMEVNLARGLLRPLGHVPGAPTPVEVGTLQELAALPKERDRVRFLFIARAFSRLV